MAATKLSCPECGTVLRPAKPVAPGKKVKCPRCETVFTAGEDEELDVIDMVEEEEERPRRKAKVPAKAKAGKAAAKKPKEEDDGAYGLFKDKEEDEENKPKINYAPDMSIKDLRGPAVAILMPPTNKLTLTGFIGVAGWFVLIILLMIPAMFPIIEDDKNAAPVMT